MTGLQSRRRSKLAVGLRPGFLAMLVLLSGCAPVGVKQAPELTATQGFDFALMAYIRGDLEQAEHQLNVHLAASPYDRRASELLDVVQRERKKEPLSVDPLPSVESKLPAMMTLLQLVRLVEARNVEMRQAMFSIVEGRGQMREANLSLSPEFSVLTRFYPLGFFASLTESIYGGIWKRQALLGEAEQATLAALAAYAKVRQQKITEALRAYVDWIEARKIGAMLREELLAARERSRAVSLLSDYGSLLPKQLMDARLLEEEIMLEIARAEGQAAVAQATINSLLDRPAYTAIDLIEQPLKGKLPEPIGDAVQRAHEQRLDLEEAETLVAQAIASRQVVGTSLPRVDLRATYGETSESGRGDFLEGFGIGALFRGEVLFWPIRKAKLDRQTAFIRQLQLEEAKIRHQIAVDVINAHQGLVTAENALYTTDRKVEAGDEQRRVSLLTEDYRVDTAFSTHDSEIEYLQAVRARIEDEYEVQRAALRVVEALGDPMEQLAFFDVNAVDRLELSGDGRALWVWRPSFLTSPQHVDFFITFCEARGIKAVFLFTSMPALQANPEIYERFLLRAHNRGIRIDALNGEPDWFDGGKAVDFAKAVLGFNARTAGSSRFDAVHLDIEPHVAKRWPKNAQESLLRGYLQLLQELGGVVRAGGSRLSVDVPHWYLNRQIGSEPLLEQIFDRVDDLALMTYTPDFQQVSQVVARATEVASLKGKRLWFGLSADPKHLCGPAIERQFEKLASAVEAQTAGQESVKGVAIHDLRRYQDLILAPGGGHIVDENGCYERHARTAAIRMQLPD